MVRYKGIKVNAIGLPIFHQSKPLKKLARKKRLYNISFETPFNKSSPKNLLVMYDIPHELKKERDWFRRQLIKFEYIMIQKSVWIGPSPLPREFIEYLKEIKIKDKFKTFKLDKNKF